MKSSQENYIAYDITLYNHIFGALLYTEFGPLQCSRGIMTGWSSRVLASIQF